MVLYFTNLSQIQGCLAWTGSASNLKCCSEDYNLYKMMIGILVWTCSTEYGLQMG